MNIEHNGGNRESGNTFGEHPSVISKGRDQSTDSLTTSVLTQAATLYQEEAVVGKAQADLSSLINEISQGLTRESNWQIAPGAYLLEHYVERIRSEFREKLFNAHGLFQSIKNIKEPILRTLVLSHAEHDDLLSLKAFADKTSSDAITSLRGKTWHALISFLDREPKQLLETVGLIARHNALKRLLAEIGPTLSAVRNRIAQGEAVAGFEDPSQISRLLIKAPYSGAPVSVREEWLAPHTKSACNCITVTQELTASEKAEKVINYLERISLASCESASKTSPGQGVRPGELTDATRLRFVKCMADRIACGAPLRFSLYLSLEKFANPLDTQSSEIDVGELRIVHEIEQLVNTVSSIVGQAPKIIIFNESTANKQFTNGKSDIYRDQLQVILDAKGLGQTVEFRPFDRDFFITYLTGQDMPLKEAEALFDQSFSLMRKIYSDIQRNRLSLAEKDTLRSFLKITYPEYPEAIREKLASYVTEKHSDILSELNQSLRSERAGGLDPSIFLPQIPSQMLLNVLTSLQQDCSLEDKGEEGLRRLLVQQAAHQGPFFKALMRMRHFLVYYTGGPSILPADIVPLSITGAQDKLSIALGRTRNTGISVLKDDHVISLEGVLPQHGTGVLTNTGIVSIRWQNIIDNAVRFHPVRIEVKGVSVHGFVRTMPGMLSDLDGTLIHNDEELGSEACALINDALVAGIPFGIATGRSDESLQRLVFTPLKRYLIDIGMDPSAPCYRKLFISSNNGALSRLGLVDPVILDQRPIDLNEFNKLHPLSFVRAVLQRCFGIPGSAGNMLLAQTVPQTSYDKYCLYLEEADLHRVSADVRLRDVTTLDLAHEMNLEFEREGIELRALANSKSIDIVHATVDKGHALRLFCKVFDIQPEQGDHVLCVGDSPAGNDQQLLDHPGGQHAITIHGGTAVVGYARAMLNLPLMDEFGDMPLH